MLAQLSLLFLGSGAAIAAPLANAVTGTKYFFVFGDSYTSTGFSISGAKPSASNPMGNPALPGSTFSGGLTWPGFLATQLNTSLTLTFNFAVAGATVDNSIVQAYRSGVPSIADQTKTWTTNLRPKPSYAPWTAESALFGVWIGVNDVGNSFEKSGSTLVTKDLDRYFSLLETLYTGGARNFVLLNIPPTNKTPQMKSNAKVADLTGAIRNWNTQLPTRVATFKAANPEANVTIVDTHPPWEAALGDPKAYGAPDINCSNSNGKSCLWYDRYHPGTAIQKLVAQTVATALKGNFF
ncbi:carbohydrate esterase family 16 protein [Lasiosphaeris hirsuta]|uniref:Carbohydrate esterase family 16 protein n=1 Tax=Lasiosphaeris hirsuta TaxID=260670 RepID=A0AA40DMN6_9PEZI|nr:carbohydrate esterase family 16 protein [Lasiosphaeris hirsuta]